MEALLKNEESSRKPSDVINFKRRLRDGCKVMYISNARVTEADADDWMALPLLKEKETEATFSQRHFLLLHVPSLREFLHKFDALPPSPPLQKEIEPSIKVEEGVPLPEFLRSIDLKNVVYHQPEDTVPLQAPPIEFQRSNGLENAGPLIDFQRSIKLEEPDKDQLFEGPLSIKLEEPEEGHVFDYQRSIKQEDPDIDTGSVHEASVVTSSVLTSSVFSTITEADDVIDEPKAEQKTSPSRKRRVESSPLSSIGSSYFELDDEPPSEQRATQSTIAQEDLTQLSDFFSFPNFGEGGASTPSFSFSSSPPCTYRIEPVPVVAFGPAEIAAPPPENPAVAFINLIAQAAAATATATAGETMTHEQPALSETIVDLPLTRNVCTVSVKKQATVQSPCPRCYVMIEKLDEAKAHIEEGTCITIGAHACDVCAKRLASKWTLKKHIERHAEKPRCGLCSNRFDSLEELRDHNLLSGHMLRPEEASAGSLEISALRKQRRKEQKDAIRNKEMQDNLASIMMAVVEGTTVPAAAPGRQPAAKKRKTTTQHRMVEDESASAVAFLMQETVEGGNE
ncbi:hypothetical protein PMAYCL1PPCAC_11398 [Pristionchus mayeri]|uniref:C2H2-type domain-containing protein n=1 Tax=Pristionchus mayeri TaxID=1317129 RepID=A0AAN4ZMH6_9BILA|nr:hypothetical protein PMAYCL1PPCAC_11398 [Pristionchus mayeri]